MESEHSLVLYLCIHDQITRSRLTPLANNIYIFPGFFSVQSAVTLFIERIDEVLIQTTEVTRLNSISAAQKCLLG